MPALTWDSPTLTWDSGSATWDGQSSPTNATTSMPNDNRISAALTAANKTSILTKIGEIRALLPFLINLTGQERRELPKMGDKTLAFDEKCATYMAQNPGLVPGFVDVDEVNKDRALRLPLSDVLRELQSLTEAVSDTALLVGSEIYMADLSFYQNARQAAKRGVLGADTIHNDLKERFPGGNGGTPATPPAVP